MLAAKFIQERKGFLWRMLFVALPELMTCCTSLAGDMHTGMERITGKTPDIYALLHFGLYDIIW